MYFTYVLNDEDDDGDDGMAKTKTIDDVDGLGAKERRTAS